MFTAKKWQREEFKTQATDPEPMLLKTLNPITKFYICVA